MVEGRKHIVKTLMDRDGITEEEAKEQVRELRESMNNMVEQGNIMEAMDVCEEVGLEPDYIEDLM